MPSQVLFRDIKDLFRRIAHREGEDWFEKQPAYTGKLDGITVQSARPGMIWVRLVNGKELEVVNTLAPGRFNVHVKIGRNRSRPDVWQVIETREPWDTLSTGGAIPYHHEQHMFNKEDMLPVDRRQILQASVMVKDPENFIVRVVGDVRLTPNGNVKIYTQNVNVSAHVPSTGARYVSIESNNAGVLSVQAGTVFGAPGIATAANMPVPAAGKYTRAHILLFEGQTVLLNDHIIIPAVDINPTSDIVQFLDDLQDVDAPSPSDGQVLTWDAYAEVWVAEDPTGGGVTDHGALTGLGDDDHTQYQLKSLLTTLGDIIYATAASTWARLAGNTTTTKKFLRQTGNGTISAAPAWDTLVAGDIPDLSTVYNAITGWIPVTETWTRTGNHTFTVSGDLTTKYRKGTKILYQDGGGNEYGVVASSSHAAGTTTVNLFVNTDFAMAAATITDTYISYIESPQGFPEYFNYTPIGAALAPMTYTITSVIYAQWKTSGATCIYHAHVSGTTGGTASNRIGISPPVTILDSTNTFPGSAAFTDGGATPLVGTGGAHGSSNTLFTRKNDGTNFGLGASRLLQVAGSYQF